MKKSVLINSIDNFFFLYEEYLPKSIFRVLLSMLCIIQIFAILPDLVEMFGNSGLIRESINDQLIASYLPKVFWFSDFTSIFGISEQISISLLFTIYILALILIIINYNSLMFSILAWGIHLMFHSSCVMLSYGVDYFISFGLFINVFLCLDDLRLKKVVHFTMDSFFIRLLQIHLCIVYFFAGFGKILGHDWWDGNALWKVVGNFSPDLVQYIDFLTNYPLTFKIMTWSVLFFELFYPILIFHKKTRRLALIVIISMHLGIIIFMGLYYFGAIMIVLNLAAFGHYLFNPDTQPNNKNTRISRMLQSFYKYKHQSSY